MCVLLAAWAGAADAGGGAGAGAGAWIVPGRVVVGFDGAAPARRFARGRAQALGLRPGRAVEALGMQVVEVPPGYEAEWARRLASEPGVRYAEPDVIFDAALEPSDSLFGQQWHLRGPESRGGDGPSPFGNRAEDAWNWSFDSGYLILGVLDSGIDFDHPDLAPNIFIRPPEPVNGRDDDQNGFVDDSRGWNFVSDNNDPSDDFGHGTEVAGVLGAAGNNGRGVSGVLWHTQMLAVKILNQGGHGTSEGVSGGVVYAVNAGAKILNMSIASPLYTNVVHDALAYARDHGVIVVVAAGNGGMNLDETPTYPASFDLDNIVPVASSTRTGTLRSTSNYGGRVLLAAPGEWILTTTMGGGYLADFGTSLASPQVAAAAALYWNRRPWESYHQVITALGAAVQPRPGLHGRVASGGILDLRRLMLEASGDSFPPAPVTDLTLVSQHGGQVTLAFTAGGEDGRLGRAESYDLRWSRTPIDAASFRAAQPVPLGRPPVFGGTPDTLVADGLPARSTVYLALQMVDRVHNRSAISNVVTAHISSPPTICVSADTVSFAIQAGSFDGTQFKIRNCGDLTLEGELGRFGDRAVSWTMESGGEGFVLEPGDSAAVLLQVNAGHLAVGHHLYGGLISSNDPDTPVRTVWVDVDVVPGSGSPARGDSSIASRRAGGDGAAGGHSGGGAPGGIAPGGTPGRLPGYIVRLVRSPAVGEARFDLGSAWIPDAGALSARILDVSGRSVAIPQVDAAGGRMAWDGRLDSGAPAPSGIYFIALEGPRHRAVMRFMRLR